MTRYEKAMTMSIEEVARIITSKGLTDAFCKGSPECAKADDCLHEVECCVKWLNEESEADA